MSTFTPRPSPSGPASWGIALAAGSLLLIGGGTLIWSNTDPASTLQPAGPAGDGVAIERLGPDGEVGVARRVLPIPPSAGMNFHSVAYAVENGTRVVKIKVAADGDELVVDAATGRLIEARPSRPTAPPPMGRFAAPFDPMT